MAFDFKQDLDVYEGQKTQQPMGGSGNLNPTIGALIGKSPTQSAFNFENDIKEYQPLSQGPGDEALSVDNIIEREKAIEEQKAENDRIRRQQELDQMPDPTDEVAVHIANSPDELLPTANIEIDYANVDLSREDLTAVPEGTVGGHCGVYAENVVKLEDGSNWVVGDSIGEKKQSVERYRKGGAAFKPGEDTPQPGQTIIQDVGTKWGHVAVINDIDEDGVATLTESNWNWDKKVTHSRKIRLDDPTIVGFIRTK